MLGNTVDHNFDSRINVESKNARIFLYETIYREFSPETKFISLQQWDKIIQETLSIRMALK